MNFNYIKKESKKLGSISLILVGSFLIIEHIYTYGGIHLLDILGHEWLGILFIVLGLLLANKKFSDGNWIEYAKQKLNSLVNN